MIKCKFKVLVLSNLERVTSEALKSRTLPIHVLNVCSSCLLVSLVSLASRSRNQEESTRAIPPRIFQKHVQLLGTASSYSHSIPKKYQLGAALLAM